MNNVDITDYISLSQAAQALGYASTGTLRLYCLEGRIPGTAKIGRNWLIPRQWVLSERENPSISGRGGRGGSRGKA